MKGGLAGYDKSKGRQSFENLAGSNSLRPQTKAALDVSSSYDADYLRNASKGVDENGEPLAMYYSTASYFAILGAQIFPN